VLDAIARGIDLFDGGFPALATDSHCALVFPIDPFDDAQVTVSKEAVTEASLVQTIPTPSTDAESTERPAKRVKLAAVAADESSSAKPANRPTPHTAPPPSVIGAPAYIARMSCPSYRLDTRPLVPGCTCHTCTNHTRAYLQHLCVTQEMTSNVLLQIHNLHHYSRFFEAARQHVAAGTFDAYRERMMAYVAQPVLVSELTSSAAAAPKSTESVL
jgi:queuine tRNA-ribosyltransferase subunit QTRTD1